MRLRMLMGRLGMAALLLGALSQTAHAQSQPFEGYHTMTAIELLETGYTVLSDFVNSGLVAIPIAVNLSRVLPGDAVLTFNPHMLLSYNPSGSPFGTSFILAPSVEMDWRPFSAPFQDVFFGGWTQFLFSAGTWIEGGPTVNQGVSIGAAAAAVAGYRHVFASGFFLSAALRGGVSYSQGFRQSGNYGTNTYVDPYGAVDLSVGVAF